MSLEGKYDQAMHIALELAEEAGRQGDVPIGAVVVGPSGKVIGSGYNRREQDQDPTAHAEILALRAAGQALGNWNLSDCTLVVTVEPCTMCAGAAVNARIKKLVFGAWEPKTGAAGSLRDVVRDSRLNHQVEVTAGVCEKEVQEQLRNYFQELRS